MFWNRCKVYVSRERENENGKISLCPKIFLGRQRHVAWHQHISPQLFWTMLAVVERWQLHHVIPFTLDDETSYRAISVEVQLALKWQKSSDAKFSPSTLWTLKRIYCCKIHPCSAETWPGFPFQQIFGHPCSTLLAVYMTLSYCTQDMWAKAMTLSYCYSRLRAHAVGLSRSTKTQVSKRSLSNSQNEKPLMKEHIIVLAPSEIQKWMLLIDFCVKILFYSGYQISHSNPMSYMFSVC